MVNTGRRRAQFWTLAHADGLFPDWEIYTRVANPTQLPGQTTLPGPKPMWPLLTESVTEALATLPRKRISIRLVLRRPRPVHSGIPGQEFCSVLTLSPMTWASTRPSD